MNSNENKKDFFGYIKNLKYLPNFFASKAIGFGKKALITGIFIFLGIYLVSPIDVVPDFIPVFGYLEDAVVLFSMLSYIGSLIKKETDSFDDVTPKKAKKKDSKGATIIEVKFQEPKDKNPKDEA